MKALLAALIVVLGFAPLWAGRAGERAAAEIEELLGVERPEFRSLQSAPS